MSLPGDLVKRLEVALLDAFPDDDAFDRLLRRLEMQGWVPARPALIARIGALIDVVTAQGRIFDLLDVARDLAPGNAILEQLRPAVLAQLSETRSAAAPERSSISAELRDRIVEAVCAVEFSREQLVDAYLASAPEVWRPYVRELHEPDLARSMLVKLSTALGQRDGVHPILLFVLHLMEMVSVAPALSQLHEWFVDAAHYLGVDAGTQQRMQQQVASTVADARVMHLVVVIRELPSSRDRFGVRASCVLARPDDKQWDARDIRLLDLDLDRAYAADELPGMLNELFDQVIEEVRRCDNNLVVELMVPLGFFSCDADRWALQRGLGRSVPLGVDYQVVLRSWERSYNSLCRRIAPVWEAKWRCSQVPGTPAWVCTEADAGRIDAVLHGDGPTSVLLGFAPDPEAVLGPIVAAGVPVAVWPRESSTSLQIECVEDLASRPAIWPALVKKYRRNAYSSADPKHLGHHLSVLWDDPNKRLSDALPSARLVSPARHKKAGS